MPDGDSQQLSEMTGYYHNTADSNQPDAANDMRGAIYDHICNTMFSTQTSLNESGGGN
jgi:hypothetical protein